MKRFKLAAGSAHPEDLDDGRMVAPGETVDLTAEQMRHPHNARLIDEGILLALSEKPAEEKKEGTNA